jgi:hypothetical protein
LTIGWEAPQKWSTLLLCVFAGRPVVGLCFVIWKVRGLRKIDAAERLALHGEGSRAGSVAAPCLALPASYFAVDSGPAARTMHAGKKARPGSVYPAGIGFN